MIYLISCTLVTLNSVCVFIKKESKILVVITVLFLAILFAGNYQNPDYNAYLNFYNENAIGNSNYFFNNGEYGYYFLSKLSVFLGLSYNFFLFIISLSCMLLMLSTVGIYGANRNLFCLLYSLYPFFMDVVQVRNFMVMSILIFSIRFWGENSIKSSFKVILLLLISSTIQISAIAFLGLFFLFKFIKIQEETIKKIWIFLFIIAIIFVSINLNVLTNIVVDIAANIGFSGEQRIVDAVSLRVNLGFLIPLSEQIISFLLCFWSYRIIKQKKNENKFMEIEFNRSNQYVGVETIYLISLCAFIFVPLYFVSSNFGRYIRDMIPIYYISYILAFLKIKDDSLLKVLFAFIVFLFICMEFWYHIYFPYGDTIVNSIFKYNLVF